MLGFLLNYYRPEGNPRPMNNASWGQTGLEMEKLVILIMFILMTPTILGAILGIIWNLIWVFFVAFAILMIFAGGFKFFVPNARCSIPDMIFSVLLSAGVNIPNFIYNTVSQFMAFRSTGQVPQTDQEAAPAPTC